MRHSIQGAILTPSGWRLGELQHEHGRIAAINAEPVDEATARASGAPIVLPGFIDLHVHGGGGHDTMDAGEAVKHIARTHARHGTTSMLATTMTAPAEDILRAFEAMGAVCRERPSQATRVLGVHLEGPYINPGKLGAQPDYAREASLDEVRALHALAPIRLITVAPELKGHIELIAQLVREGFRVQLGHSAGCYEDGVAALKAGAGGFTHLFNAMTGLHHRDPGMTGAALAHAEYAEVIPDLLHVHPGALKVALRSIPKLYGVTDSTAATGMPDGEYHLGRHKVFKCLGGVRLDDGTLAGSALTMDQALRNFVSLGLSVAEASARTATHAADYLGLAGHGRLTVGAAADIVVFDPALQLQRVVIEGETIDHPDA
ncbi:N-acetylglucosamine-6-phosphate deacetylase [Ideonella sp. DXS29W]|uniref:N-acetylglucosamine-6-phosphate deacetylase n=1 Tax=Ideonella lacteola TaxID=2984193 RepID=A0ABU9BUG9_9BURK